jgi:hypothetical protein
MLSIERMISNEESFYFSHFSQMKMKKKLVYIYGEFLNKKSFHLLIRKVLCKEVVPFLHVKLYDY